MEKKIPVKELRKALGENCKIFGRKDRYVLNISPINESQKESLSWCSRKDNSILASVKNSKASVIICPDSVEFPKTYYKNKTLIQVSNPRLAFIRIVQRYFVHSKIFGIHSTAVIDKKAKIAPCVYIGPHTYIGECEIGEGTVIYGNVHIYPKTKIGKNVIIHAGAVIGADGFGFERGEKGKIEKFFQLGGVVIEDDVEIGSNACIDRGALGNTIIGEGTKIDNLVHIAHNVRIGKHCLITAQSLLAGGVKVGDYCYIAPQVCIKEKISIGNCVFIGMKSLVIKDVKNNLMVAGIPAIPIRKNFIRGRSNVKKQ